MKKNEAELPVIQWSWDDVIAAVDVVVDRIFKHTLTGYLGVVYIPNGGVIPAALISRSLGFRGRVKSLKDNPTMEGKWIVIDEIADSGKTMATVKAMMPNCIYACLVGTSKARGVLGEDVIFGETIDGSWIQFPWEEDGEEAV